MAAIQGSFELSSAQLQYFAMTADEVRVTYEGLCALEARIDSRAEAAAEAGIAEHLRGGTMTINEVRAIHGYPAIRDHSKEAPEIVAGSIVLGLLGGAGVMRLVLWAMGY